MTNSEARSHKRVDAQHTGWIWAMCLIALTACRLSANEPSVSNKAWSTLEAGLHDKKADNRVLAVSALGLMPGDRKAAEAAEQALEDSDATVRRAGIAALGEMNAKTSLPKIKALISHSDAKTVVAIAAVLTKFKDPEGYDIYYQLLTGKRKGGGSILDGIKDRKDLEKMGVETALGFVPFGGIGTGAYDYFKRNGSSDSNLSVTAVFAVAEDPDPVVKKALVQSSFNGKEVVQAASLRALAKRGDPTVINDIEPAMYSGKPLIIYTTAATILHLMDLREKQSDQYQPKATRSHAKADELGN